MGSNEKRRNSMALRESEPRTTPAESPVTGPKPGGRFLGGTLAGGAGDEREESNRWDRPRRQSVFGH